MKTRWYIKDLIDLEYFLHIGSEDTPTHQLENNTQDREIFLKNIQPKLSKTKSFPRRFIIKSWLDLRRKIEKDTGSAESILPGEAFAETFHLLEYVLFFLGILSGIGLAFSLLTYTGTAPLNISVYLGTTVFVQILLLLFLAAIFLIRLIQPRLFYTSVIYSVLSRLIISLTRKFKRQFMTSLSASRREGLLAVNGLVKGKKQIYGSVFYWPVFILAQIFGIGFNLGILATTLIKVIGTDMAFGWQSTLQVSSNVVYSVVKWLALPWSWFVPPELAHPGLTQIEGSHMILKDGIYHLATSDLVAWWPFLCFAVLFYGLLPRVVLFFSGRMTQKYLLDSIKLTNADCDQLIDRMTTPQVQFGNQEGPLPKEAATKTSHEPVIETDNQVIDKKYIVLIPNDIFETASDKDLKKIIGQTLNGELVEKIRIDNIDTLETITGTNLIPSKPGKDWDHILILQEAWQPPIVENIAFIKMLRQQLGNRTPILLGLIGKPNPETIFTRVKPVNWQPWKDKITGIGDPYLRVKRLIHEN